MPVIQVKVKPRSRESALQPQPDGTYLALLKSPPVEGEANAELVALLARHFGTSRAAVRIKTGAGSRLKRVTIDTSPSTEP